MIRALAWLHRWTGGIVGLVLALLGLSGAVLVWKDDWIALPYASAAAQTSPEALARAVEAATSEGELSRITFPAGR